jgi:hypothetical protein
VKQQKSLGQMLIQWEKLMIINDLSFLDEIIEEADRVQGGENSVAVGSFAVAVGDMTLTIVNSVSIAVDLPYDGGVAIGYSSSLGIAYTPPSVKRQLYPGDRSS